MMRRLILLFILAGWFNIPTVQGQADAYHSSLRTQFETEFNVTGGTWVLGETEAVSMGRVFTSGNANRQNITVSDMPFTRAVRLRVPVRGANPWDYFIGFSMPEGFSQGDRGVLVVWARGISAERGEGLLNANIEMNRSPWTKTLVTGLLPSDTWQQWLIPFEAAINHAVGEVQLIFHLGIMAQEIEIGGVAVINYQQTYTLGQLPATNQDQDYAGRSLVAPWRVDAANRIDRYRKRSLRLQVVDVRGTPVTETPVHIRMNRHHFGFGTAIAVGRMIEQSADGAMYRSKLEDLTGEGHRFSTSVLENALKWRAWEGNWPANKTQKLAAIQDLKALGMTIRGHNLVWPGWDFLPDALRQYENDPATMRTLVEDRIRTMAGYDGVKGELIDWDVLNEPAHLTDLADVFARDAGFTTGEEIYAEWFKLAAEVDPTARLYINEYSILSNLGLDLANQERYRQIIDEIEALGATIHGVGVQGHMGTPLTPPETIYEILDEFSAGGKELSITEYDASGVEETLAADYMRDMLTIAFSHPAVNSFLMWGFWDGAHWKNDAPLFRQDWSLKPSGQAFFDLVFDTWWTDAELVTDDEGYIELRGFHGDYDVEIVIEGVEQTYPLSLTPGEVLSEQTITLPQQVAVEDADARPDALYLEPHYPSPANEAINLSFHLPDDARVYIEIYDMLGRRVEVVDDTFRIAGRHLAHVDTRPLRSGMYMVHVRAAGWSAQQLLTIIR